MTTHPGRLLSALITALVAALIAAGVATAAPSIGALSPWQAKAGDPAFSLVVDGSGFTDGATGSKVLWNGSARPTTWVSENRLVAAISAADVDESVNATVQVTTPGQGTSGIAGFPVVNPQPYVYDFDPRFRVRGGGAFVLTVKGAGFVRGSKVLWNSTERPTDYVDHTTLTATIRADDVASRGSAQLQVVSPPPEGGLSRWSETYYVTNPIPTITSFSPSQGVVGAGDTTITITGTNFTPASVAYWGGCSSSYSNCWSSSGQYVSPTQMRVTAPAAALAAAGRGYIQVYNPGGPYENSDYVPWTIGVAPNTAPADATDVRLFGRDGGGSQKEFTTAPYVWPGTTMFGRARFGDAEGGPLTIEVNWRYNNGSYLDNRVLTTKVSGPGVHEFPLPNLEASLAGAFVARVRARDADGAVGPWHYILPTDPDWTVVSDQPPVVTTISPRTAPVGSGARTLTVSGSGFTRGAVVQWNGETRPTTFISASQLTATLTASDFSVATGASVRVINATFNAPSSGQVSNATAFEVEGAGGPAAPRPVSLAPPTISGAPRAGELLACGVGTWANAPTSFGITWLRDGQAIPGASGGTYLATVPDVGHLLACRVSANNGGGVGTAVSDVVAIGAGATPAPAALPALVAAPVTTGGTAAPKAKLVAAARRLAIAGPLTARAGKAFRLALRFDKRATRQLVAVQIRSARGRWATLASRRVSGLAPVVSVVVPKAGRTVLRVTWRSGGVLRTSGTTVVLVRPAAR